jgi:hypothetical protein
MEESAMEKKLADLIDDAKVILNEFLETDASSAKSDSWFMYVKSQGSPGEWESLFLDAHENDRRITSAVREAGSRISDLVILYVGMLDWRGESRLMAYGQHFRSGYDDGLLFGSYLTRNQHTDALQRSSDFLILGGVKNIWMSQTEAPGN